MLLNSPPSLRTLLCLACWPLLGKGNLSDTSTFSLALMHEEAASALELFPDNQEFVIERDEVDATLESLWGIYTDVARRAGLADILTTAPQPADALDWPSEGPLAPSGVLSSGDLAMPYVLLAKGEKPSGGWPLFIALHGGGKYHGNAEISAHGWEVNTREWQTQMRLVNQVYEPDGLYFVPRMADDRLGRWWHQHNIELFRRLIRCAVLYHDVNPNRVYIMGISQGGYGTCHIAPFMADLFAAAGSMAGGMMTVTENLRNLPFRSDIGANDTAYNRIELAKQLHDSLDTLQSKDSDAYRHTLAIQANRGHGIDYSSSPSWLARHSRNPYPERIVWRCHEKDGVYRRSFYWLSLSQVPDAGEYVIKAELNQRENRIDIKAEEVLLNDEGEPVLRRPLTSSQIHVHLNDTLLDLDREVLVLLNDRVAFRGRVERKQSHLLRSLIERGDPNYAFPAKITVGGPTIH